MACLVLPCDCEEWWEDKKFFLLLMHLHSLDEFSRLIKAHSRRAEGEDWGFSRRLRDLEGLRAFLVTYCSPEEQQTFFNQTLPFIAKSASCLDERVPETGIPFLERHEGTARLATVNLILNKGSYGNLKPISPLAKCTHCRWAICKIYSSQMMIP